MEFPPKTDAGDLNLLEKHTPALLRVNLDSCSVTYVAGSNTRDKPLMIVDSLQRQHGAMALAHLTCVNHTRDEVHTLLEKFRALGCKNVLALRGDPPGGGDFQPTPGAFEFASQLVNFVREQGDFSIGAAGFPAGHIACQDGKYADYFTFRDYVAGQLGVRVPLVPGFVPILNALQITKSTQLCGAKIPPPFLSKLNQLANDNEAVTEFGIE